MRRSEILQEVRMKIFENIYRQFKSKKISCEDAASMLNASVSSFYRMRQRYEEDGIEGLVDKRLEKASARRAPVDEVMHVINLFKTQYYDFTVKHFYEKLPQHGIQRSYSWTKNVLQNAEVIKKATHRGAHRRKRPRKPMPGMMLHQDASSHEWTPGARWDLIVTMDDATSEIYSAFFVEEEGTMSTFKALKEVIRKKGLFGSLYTDRGSHYWKTPEAGGKVDKYNLTQVGRALNHLGIEHIPAYSPEARGRSERTFGTLQLRLPQELRIRGITNIKEANEYLRNEYIFEHNKRFSIRAEGKGSAFVRCVGRNLDDILCIQEERIVSKDNTVVYNRLQLQIPKDRHRSHYVKAKVRVCEYPDKTLAIFHGPRKLATYNEYGEEIGKKGDKLAA
jgi:transposase